MLGYQRFAGPCSPQLQGEGGGCKYHNTSAHCVKTQVMTSTNKLPSSLEQHEVYINQDSRAISPDDGNKDNPRKVILYRWLTWLTAR